MTRLRIPRQIAVGAAFLILQLGTSAEAANPISSNTDLIASRSFEQVKANIVDENPKTFTIDVYSLANMFVDQEAPDFAVYTTPSAPKECADFRTITLAYDKPEKYKRRFDLTKHADVLNAIETHKCVIIRNIPSGSTQAKP